MSGHPHMHPPGGSDAVGKALQAWYLLVQLQRCLSVGVVLRLGTPTW